MTAIPRRGFLGILGAAAALCTGCQASTMAYFLFPEAKHEAEMKNLASEDNKEVRVAILTYSTDLETRPELIQADRQLSEMLAAKLRELCEANNENVTIVSPHKVEEFKISHPNWQQEPNLADIGKQFKADYLIYIEISKLSMYEKGSPCSTRARRPCRSGGGRQQTERVAVAQADFLRIRSPAAPSQPRTCSRWSSAKSSSATRLAAGPQLDRRPDPRNLL